MTFIYLLALIVAAAATLAIRLRARSVDVPLAGLHPSAEDVGFLEAGRERLIETSIAALADRKVIRIGRAGVLSLVNHRTPKPRTDLERVIVARVQAGTTVARLKKSMADHATVINTAISLQERGLLLRHTQSMLLAAASPLAVVAVAGLLWFPVWLVLITFVLLVTALLPLQWMPYTARRSTAGSYAISQAPADKDAAMMVALDGLEVYPDPVVAKALRSKPIAPRHGALDCAGSCGSA